jgi:hypothetical protein
MMKENVPWMPGLYVSVDGDIFELRNNNWVQLRIYHSLSKNHKYYQKHPNWTTKQLQSKFKVKSYRPLRKIIRGEDPIIAEYLKEVE